jgi:hypothetical protein
MLETAEQNIEITTEQIASWHPLICLPCYDRQITEPFFMSTIKAAVAFKEYGMKFGISTISDSLISRARNQLVAKFMANPLFTHLLFIDVDLGYNYEDILKMLWHDKEIMTGAYPIKEINWDKVVNLVNQNCQPDKIAEKSTRFVVNPVMKDENRIRMENGALSIYDAGTGFMLIKRSAFEKLFEAYPELKYVDDTGALKGNERDYSYALFNSYVDDDGRFLSEDYGFGRYWQKIGGQVWVDPSIELTHLGRFEYKGRLIDWIVDNATVVSSDDEDVKPVKKTKNSKTKK